LRALVLVQQRDHVDQCEILLVVAPRARPGVKPVRETLSPKTARLLKRLRRVEELPPADQRAVLKLVDAMLEPRRRSTPPTAARKRKAS
jgi:hypothetical protein